MPVEAPEPFPVRLKHLARERRTSVERVAHAAWDQNVEGTSPSTLRKALSGDRPLPLQLVEALAAVLEVEPETFPEYRLARARRLLDEREVGLDEALQNLARVESALLSREEAPETPSPTLREAAEEADRRSSGSRGTPSEDESPSVARVSRQRRSA
jgi:transcriptional regulator with XRE-family HTH domain